jgi:peptidoglycan/xylan/chitin deacetylase (PgdA/CDA1 family)/glycosyltransferase involved in cell wall biosynthesis
MIKLSVIIPTFNRRHILERTLPALLAQDLPAEDYEIIIVMDGSTDGTAEFLRGWKPKCAFRALIGPHRGPSAARNMGIRAAVGDLVLFLDDDLICSTGLLRQHCEAHSSSERQVIHGPIYVAPEGSQTIIRHVLENFYDTYYRSLDPNMELRYPDEIGSSLSVLSSLVNSSMPRDILIRCGGFDEDILASEDLELGLRLWKLGIAFRFLPAAVAQEYYQKSSSEYLAGQARALGAGDLVASRKHPEYRRYSSLSSFAETRFVKKWSRAWLIRLPISMAPVLTLPLRLETWFYRFPPLRRLGMCFLRLADSIARLRGALSIAGSSRVMEDEFNRRAPALAYHQIGPPQPGTYPGLTVSPKQFERQIRWLARRGYTGVRPSDWVRWQREGKGLPEKPIMITFDDAYSDIAEHALPILRRYGFGAAVFVVSGRVGGTNTWDEAQGSSTLRLMTAEQIRYWATQGIEFGAHSRTHPDLTKLSKAECLEEIAGSKDDLVGLLGSPVTSFAYPYGKYNNTVRGIVREHFDCGFSIEEGVNYLRGDPYLLRRAYIGPYDSLIEFAACVHLGSLRKFRDWRVKLAIRTRLKSAFRRLTGRFSHQEPSQSG